MKVARSSSAVSVAANPERLLHDVRKWILATHEKIARCVDSLLVLHYWQIGQRIRMDVLNERRAEYGQEILQTRSAKLVIEFSRGYAQPNLASMTRFAEVFPEPKVVAALSQQLGWKN